MNDDAYTTAEECKAASEGRQACHVKDSEAQVISSSIQTRGVRQSSPSSSNIAVRRRLLTSLRPK